jgi:hypothetical protein
MGLKPDSPVCDSFTHIVPVLQEINANINANLNNNNNTRNHVHTNKPTKVPLYKYNKSNDSNNKDTNIITHNNNNTPSSSQDQPSKASTHDSNGKTNLSIFHQNIRGLFNKTDELVTSWSTEAPHILCLPL